MYQSFASWLGQYDIALDQVLQVAKALGLIALIAIIIHLVLHRAALPWFRRLADKQTSDATWKKALRGKLFTRFALLVQGIVVAIQANLWLLDEAILREVIMTLVALWIVVYSLLTLFSFLDLLEEVGEHSHFGRNIPLRGILQSVKILLFIVAVLLMISVLIGKSPLILLSGFGAMTAVFMLVFKDPILGLVAGIQLSANKMLNVGDWLEMPKYGADGFVMDISLTTVKVQNWDKTITTVPTYALISDYFKNWKGMSESGGRRIKRHILVDATSVHFLSQDEIDCLIKAQLLQPYLQQKVEEIKQYNQEINAGEDSLINGRRLTNLGSFRAYLERYLRFHPKIHQNFSLMVRQIAPTHEGIPIEIYCFTNVIAWVEYEGIQSDIFDHIYAVIPEFGLRISQAPTGRDFQQLMAKPE